MEMLSVKWGKLYRQTKPKQNPSPNASLLIYNRQSSTDPISFWCVMTCGASVWEMIKCDMESYETIRHVLLISPALLSFFLLLFIWYTSPSPSPPLSLFLFFSVFCFCVPCCVLSTSLPPLCLSPAVVLIVFLLPGERSNENLVGFRPLSLWEMLFIY